MKFKKFLFILIFLGAISIYCHAQGKVLIQVYAPKLKDGTELKLTEAKSLNSRKPINTYKILVRNGKSEKIVSTGNGDEFWIANGNDRKSIYLQAGKAKIEIPDTLISNLIVSGNPSAEDYDNYMEDLKSQSFYKRT